MKFKGATESQPLWGVKGVDTVVRVLSLPTTVYEKFAALLNVLGSHGHSLNHDLSSQPKVSIMIRLIG